MIRVCVRNEDVALRAAKAMLETWDPLVENCKLHSAKEGGNVDCNVGELVKHYMNDSNFRRLVQGIHDHIDAVFVQELVNYEGPCVAKD
ncbi:hypothetical protein CCR75_000137 [Bremia lactucae]|uniref:Uncharacterized protein n=1 Tax=Bremia lactucae TaxID=4779 RepID=A0A976IEH9_BRELC|nr:hypothetical protein CCR75_000137 [Bremia lactucae]